MWIETRCNCRASTSIWVASAGSMASTGPLLPADLACDACIAYTDVMVTPAPQTTTLTIRHVDRRLRDQLRVRAAQHGQSMEAELRQILREVLAKEGRPPEVNLAEAIRRRMAPLGGVELELPPRMEIREPPNFDE